MKLRARSKRAVEAARALVAELALRGPRDLDVELIAADRGAYVLFSDLAGNEEGHLLHAGRRSIIRVRASLHGTPKGRFVMAHEIGHHILHADVDHFAQCTSEGLAPGGTRWRIEGEASDFASELVVPTSMAYAHCRAERPSLDDVIALAARFHVSVTTAALRYLEMTDAACAFVETRAGRVKRASGTARFRGEAIRGRVFQAPPDAVLQSLPVERTDVALTWLCQPA